MKIDERIKELMGRFISTSIDQLCEGVTDWFDNSQVTGSDESGYWVTHCIWITYKVSTDVERTGRRTYQWQTDPVTMILILQEMEEEDD